MQRFGNLCPLHMKFCLQRLVCFRNWSNFPPSFFWSKLDAIDLFLIWQELLIRIVGYTSSPFTFAPVTGINATYCRNCTVLQNKNNFRRFDSNKNLPWLVYDLFLLVRLAWMCFAVGNLDLMLDRDVPELVDESEEGENKTHHQYPLKYGNPHVGHQLFLNAVQHTQQNVSQLVSVGCLVPKIEAKCRIFHPL